MEVPQVVAFSSVVDSLKAMFMTSHACSTLKSFDYGAITIEFVNCLPTKLFKLPHVHHQLGQIKQLQSMDKKFDGHVWCKLPLQQKVSMYAK
jgi:hypothetical protein